MTRFGHGAISSVPPDDPSKRGGAPASRSGREVIFEYLPIGASVKISAIDVETGTEVSVIGPSSGSRMELERVALRKLNYMLEKKAGRGKENDTDPGNGRGGIVI